MMFKTFQVIVLSLFVIFSARQLDAQGILGEPTSNSGIQVETKPAVNLPEVNAGMVIPMPAVVDKSVSDVDADNYSPNEEAFSVPPERVKEVEGLSFTELSALIRNNDRLIDRHYIGMPVSDVERQLLFQGEIKRLKKENELLVQLLEPAAIAAFRENPNGSRAAAATVMDLLASKLSPRDRSSKYDPKAALKLVETILEIKGNDLGREPGVKPEPDAEPLIKVVYQGYLACYGMQKFDRADEYLTRLENMPIGLRPEVRSMLESTKTAWQQEEEMQKQDATANLPRVKLETSDGDVLIELFEDQAPETVANFVSLVADGFYDGLEFFQVIPSMYARTGCTENDGTTIPGYRIRNEFENARGHFAGTLVMHNDGDNTAGSQFMILHRPDPNLVGKVVAFGRVIEGMDVVYGFKSVNRIRTKGGEAATINKATIVRKRDHEYRPLKLEGEAPVSSIALPDQE
jgi:cyclophilin family peptidyl-prolyl cis-trans isomerase